MGYQEFFRNFDDYPNIQQGGIEIWTTLYVIDRLKRFFERQKIAFFPFISPFYSRRVYHICTQHSLQVRPGIEFLITSLLIWCMDYGRLMNFLGWADKLWVIWGIFGWTIQFWHTGFLKFPFQHSFQTRIKIQL